MHKRSILTVICVLLLIGYSESFLFVLTGESSRIYPARIVDEKQVYDGDTIQDVKIHVADIATGNGEVWPGVFIDDGQVFVETDIRVSGIDTPEKRPSTKNADGTPRSEASRTAERIAALEARTALLELLASNDYAFSVSQPTQGKYAGRTVAHVRVGDVDVATFLIDNNLAVAYDGGRKHAWFQD